MHVIQCADYGGPYRGSFVPMLTAVAREAASRGYPTTVVFSEVARDRPWLPEVEDVAEVRFVTAGASRRASIGNAMRELRSAVGSQRGPAVIHTHFSTFDIPAALMRLRSGETGIFWHEHGPLLADSRTRLRNSIRFVGLGPLVTAVLCVSPEIVEEVRRRHAPRRSLHYFPNAVDTGTFTPTTGPERTASRRALGLPEGARVVLHFGWDWERKGGDLVLGAADLLAGEPDLVLATVLGEDGDPPSGFAADRGVLRTLPATDDVKGLYAAADAFLSVGRAEGMPLAVLEALARGLPVIATDLPVQRLILEGLPVAETVAAEPEAIAAGILKVLSAGEAARSEHAQLARRRIETDFALAGWARRLVDLYEILRKGRV